MPTFYKVRICSALNMLALGQTHKTSTENVWTKSHDPHTVHSKQTQLW